jgi:hypothetical protein
MQHAETTYAPLVRVRAEHGFLIIVLLMSPNCSPKAYGHIWGPLRLIIYLAAQQCSAGGVHSRAWSMSDTSVVVVGMVEVRLVNNSNNNNNNVNNNNNNYIMFITIKIGAERLSRTMT